MNADLFSTFCIDDIKLLKNEIFKPLICDQYSDIKPIYMISSKGRVYNLASEKFVRTRHIVHGTNYYYRVNLKCDGSHNNMKKRVFSMHRLLMIVFKPVDGMDKLIINHIDGDKSNNDLSNLEWCDYSYNTTHAVQTGLLKAVKGDDASWSTINKNTAEKICELFMTSKYTKQEIADICNTTVGVVKSITIHGSWNEVSDKYDFSKRKSYRKSKNISIEDIEDVCEYFTCNGKLPDESVRSYIYRVIDYFGFANPKDKTYYTIRGVYDGKYYKNISNKYHFKKSTTRES